MQSHRICRAFNVTFMHEYVTILITSLPPFDSSGAVFYGVNFLIFLVVFRTLIMIGKLLLNKQLAFVSKPYTSANEQAKKILILGDSTAVGTGAHAPEETIAGRLAHDFPNAQIVNVSENGGLIKDLTKQIEKVSSQTFDIIIISAGGNDVWHFSRLNTIRKHLTQVLKRALAMSNHRVIFLHYNSIASAPLFPLLIQYFLKIEEKRIYKAIHAVAMELQVPIINLFTEETDNPFLKNPKDLFARDGIHPSSRGYEVWYHRMWLEMVKNGYHYS